MSAEESDSEGLPEPNNKAFNLPDIISEAGIAAVTGLPPTIQKSFWKVVSRIFVAAAERPAKYLEGKARVTAARADVEVAKHEAEAADIKSQQKARDLINRSSAKAAAERFNMPELADRALDFHAAHIVREQSNRERVLQIAAEELTNNPPKSDSANEINDDWLVALLKEAATRSDEDYRRAFGRILAGEIKSPGSFSIATVQALSRLDSYTSERFQRFCNLCIQLDEDVRIVSEEFASIGANNLSDCGLSYDDAAQLVETGLLRSEYKEQIDVEAEKLKTHVLIKYANTTIRISRIKPYNPDVDLLPLSFQGPSLTMVGRELYRIVDSVPCELYLRKFAKWLDVRGYSLELMIDASNPDLFKVITPISTAVVDSNEI